MADLKTIKTRISLKYDTLQNWESSTLVLKKGEVAFTEVTTGAGDNATVSVLAKVGDGTHTWKGLDYLSGKSADVPAWAKAPTESTYKVVQSGDVDATTGNATYQLVRTDNLTNAEAVVSTFVIPGHLVEINALKDKVSNIETNYATTTAVTDAVAAEKTRAEGVEGTLANLTTDEKGSLVGAINELQTEINTVSENVGDISYSLSAIAAEDYATIALYKGTNEVDKVQIFNGDGIRFSLSDPEGSPAGTGLKIANTTSANVTSDDNTHVTVNVVQDKGKITDVIVGGDFETYFATSATLAAEVTRAQTAEQANATEIARVNGVLVNAIDNNAEGLDSIKELANWIELHGTDPEELPASVGKLESISKTFLVPNETGNVTEDAIKSYIDTQDAATLSSAKTYADGKVKDVKVGETSLVANGVATLGKLAGVDAKVATSDLDTDLANTVNSVAGIGTRLDTAESEIDALQATANGLGALATKDKVAKADLDTDLGNELDAKSTIANTGAKLVVNTGDTGVGVALQNASSQNLGDSVVVAGVANGGIDIAKGEGNIINFSVNTATIQGIVEAAIPTYLFDCGGAAE